MAPAGSTFVTSNILSGDYAGSAACEGCHAAIYRAWASSPMHNMTRAAEHAGLRAPFSHAIFRFKRDAAELYEQGGERFIRLTSPANGTHLYRVTRAIGGHHREDFAGLEVDGDRAGASVIGDPRDELILPVSFVYATGSFRLKGYSVMVGERPGLRAGGVWNRTCILCHNTAPYFWSLFGALLGPGARPYQGEVVDPLLPPARRWRFIVDDEPALARVLDQEIGVFGGDPGARGSAPRARPDSPVRDEDLRDRLAGAIATARHSLTAKNLRELGIGCESCHGGSREHAIDPARRPSFLPTAPFLSIAARSPSPSMAARSPATTPPTSMAPPDGDPVPASRAEAINRTCARCHQVLFSRYPFTWEGGNRYHGPGGSHISSGEARDFLLGGCATALTCTACHDPHGEDREDHLEELETTRGNRVCTGCHTRYAEKSTLAHHSHHAPDGAGSVCINCHMPKKNMGLGYELTRYHRIGSPDEPVKVERDRPIECALCHPTASVLELTETMERWWGKRYDRAALVDLYGADLEAGVLQATLEHGKPHEKAVAMSLLGAARSHEAVPLIAREVLNRYPLVRYYAVGALAQIAGDPAGPRAIDLDQDDDRIAVEAERWLASHGFRQALGAKSGKRTEGPSSAQGADDED